MGRFRAAMPAESFLHFQLAPDHATSLCVATPTPNRAWAIVTPQGVPIRPLYSKIASQAGGRCGFLPDAVNTKKRLENEKN